VTAVFLSFVCAVTAFSDFSVFVSTFAALSVDDGFRAGGLGLGEGDVEAGATSCLGVEVPEAACELILLSDLIASFVENIRVRRFVIEGFSAAPGVSFCGSEGGAAWPLRFSVLETAIPFCVVGRLSGDPIADDADEAGGEGRAFSDAKESRGALTVAMMILVMPLGTGDVELMGGEFAA
jgi:hypothetical protein